MRNNLLVYNSYSALLFLVFLMVFSFLLITTIGTVILIPFYGFDIFNLLNNSNLYVKENIAIIKYMQVLSHIGLFILPALLFPYFFKFNFFNFYKLNTKSPLILILFGGLIILLTLPIVHFLNDFNHQLKLPETMHNIEQWMINSETQAKNLINLFLSDLSYKTLIINIMMIAVIPAIGEELIFRGVLLKVFNDIFSNVHVAVIVTSVIFSAIHLQFFGFLPRFFLGIVLAYLFVFTGNIWTAILAHFINNAATLIISFLSARKVINVTPENFGNFTDNHVFLTISIVAFILIAIFYIILNRKMNTNFFKIN